MSRRVSWNLYVGSLNGVRRGVEGPAGVPVDRDPGREPQDNGSASRRPFAEGLEVQWFPMTR
jgi:hypothetical protein